MERELRQLAAELDSEQTSRKKAHEEMAKLHAVLNDQQSATAKELANSANDKVSFFSMAKDAAIVILQVEEAVLSKWYIVSSCPLPNNSWQLIMILWSCARHS